MPRARVRPTLDSVVFNRVWFPSQWLCLECAVNVDILRSNINIFQPKPAAAAPAAAAAPSPSPAPAPAAAAPAPAAAPAAAPVVPAAPNADHVRQLTEMGFPEDQVTAALRAAMGNPDVAVEFLMTGIPDNIPVGVQPAYSITDFFSNLIRTCRL